MKNDRNAYLYDIKYGNIWLVVLAFAHSKGQNE